jgi:hypothetical protein
MAATSGQSSSKWIRYCMEHALEVSHFIDKMQKNRTLQRVDAKVSLSLPEGYESADIPESRREELDTRETSEVGRLRSR